MHICARVGDLPGPLFDITALAVDIVLVVEFDRILADVLPAITSDIEDAFDHFRHEPFLLDGQQANLLTIENGHARVGCAEVDPNFQVHVIPVPGSGTIASANNPSAV